jgi:hypothetical protein
LDGSRRRPSGGSRGSRNNGCGESRAPSVPTTGAFQIPVVANDTDADGNLDPFSVTIVSGPSMGTLTVKKVSGVDKVQYQSPNQTGTFSFVYSVCDTSGACAHAKVTVTLTP